MEFALPDGRALPEYTRPLHRRVGGLVAFSAPRWHIAQKLVIGDRLGRRNYDTAAPALHKYSGGAITWEKWATTSARSSQVSPDYATPPALPHPPTQSAERLNQTWWPSCDRLAVVGR